MFDQFDNIKIGYVSMDRSRGNASDTIVKSEDFSAATTEISTWSHYAPTPLYHLEELARQLGIADIVYKDEGARFGLGSFKALGGAYAAIRVLQRELARNLDRAINLSEIRDGTLKDEIGKITLTTATDGNHGRSLAWGAQNFGARCRIYIHREVSEMRAQAMRDYGATVIRVDTNYDESVRITRKESEENGWFVVSDTSWEGYTQAPVDVMAGYGVMADEICAEVSLVPTHSFIQAGVGGLAAALTARMRQKMGDATRMIAVEPELAGCLFESGKTGIATAVPIGDETLMAGLSCGQPSELAWKILKEEIGDFLTIPDSAVGPAMRLAARPLGDDPAIEAGESAVCGLAALVVVARQPELKTKLGLDENSSVLLIGSESATDPEIYAKIMQAA